LPICRMPSLSWAHRRCAATGLFAPIPQPPADPCRGLPGFPLLSLAHSGVQASAAKLKI
jgi:hypothetical protein